MQIYKSSLVFAIDRYKVTLTFVIRPLIIHETERSIRGGRCQSVKEIFSRPLLLS